jgi:hypothetical protein
LVLILLNMPIVSLVLWRAWVPLFDIFTHLLERRVLLWGGIETAYLIFCVVATTRWNRGIASLAKSATLRQGVLLTKGWCSRTVKSFCCIGVFGGFSLMRFIELWEVPISAVRSIFSMLKIKGQTRWYI